jgi:bacterioferritin-associated ferredoxin
MSRVYASLGCAAKCGRCVKTIKSILEELKPCARFDGIASSGTTTA